MSELLVGFDGSVEARLALRWAHELGRACHTTVRAIRTWQYPASAGAPAGPITLPAARDMDHATEAELESQLAEVLGEAATEVVAEVARGSAAGALVHRADASHAAMIVIGARGVGGFEGLLLGSTSRQCLEYAPCPVIVVRTPRADAPLPVPKRIVVGIDGSTAAGHALSWAARLAVDLDADVVAVHALGRATPQHIAGQARKHLDGDWTAPLRAARARYHTHLDEHDPRLALLTAADEVDAGLIVIGARGRGPMQIVLLGSIANHLASHATRPLAVVPTPDAAGA